MSSNAAISVGPKAAQATAPSMASASAPRLSRQVAADIVMAVDGLAVVIGAALPVSIYAMYGGIAPNWVLTFQSGLVAAALCITLLKSWGMYETTRLADLPEHPGRLLAALLIALMAVVGLGLPFAIQNAHLWVWYAAWASASYTMLLANRGASRLILRAMTEAGRFDRRVAVYGAGGIARRVHDHLNGKRLGIHFVGVYDDRADDTRVNPEGLAVAGTLTDLIHAAAEGRVDQVIIALPQVAEGRMATIAKAFERLPVSVHIVTHIAADLVEDVLSHKVSSLGSVGLIDVKPKALSDWQPIVKRTFDIIVGSLLLLVSAPVVMMAAATIALTSKGPVFERQRRRGLDQQVIEVWRLRTTAIGDGAPTPAGEVIGRFGIDALPQLVNVLAGDMSLVGPRPNAVSRDESAALALERYADRHQVKPGMTGLAQVEGATGLDETTAAAEQRLGHDIAYIRAWSLWLDVRILARALLGVARGKAA